MICQVFVNFLTQFFFADDMNLIYCKNHDELFLLNNFLKINPEWLSVKNLALQIDKIQAKPLLKNQGEEIHLSDSIIKRSDRVKYFGILIDELSNFTCLFAEVVENLSKQYSVKSQGKHYVEKRVLLQYYITFMKPVTGYGFLIYGSTSGKQIGTSFKVTEKYTQTNLL